MISNTDQPVDQEKYGDNFDRIFRNRKLINVKTGEIVDVEPYGILECDNPTEWKCYQK